MRRTAVVLVAAATLSGCASVEKRQIDTTAVASLKGQDIVLLKREKPDFAAMTAGKATFALVGALVAIDEGNKLIAQNKVPDPADAIAAGLAKDLSRAYGVRIADTSVPVKAYDAAQIAAAVGGSARYALDVATLNWSFIYYPMDWTHYRVMYVAKARLIDVANKAVVAEAACKQIPDDHANAPTYNQIVADGAAWLKRELSSDAEKCVQSLGADMFALGAGKSAVAANR